MDGERRELIAEIVAAGRRKLFGTPELCVPERAEGSPPCIGATGKENWLFHKLLDVVEAHARRLGKPHVRATYEAVGALSESEWAKDVAAGRLPSNVNTRRGPLRNIDVLQEARRNWESALRGRAETEVNVVRNRATIPAKVRFVLGSEDGVVWLATATSAFLDRRWEELTSEVDRFDSVLQVQPAPAVAEYIEHARDFAREADSVGDSGTASVVRRGIWKRYKTRISAWAAVFFVISSGAVVVSYAQSKNFRDSVRHRMPGLARLLDVITSTPPQPPAPRPPAKKSSKPPIGYTLVDLGDPVATETVDVDMEDRAHALRYDESSPVLPILLRQGATIQPQIVVTRSATNPRQAIIRAFLGDVGRQTAESYILTFDDGALLGFDGNFIENLAGRYRGFMLMKTFSKGGTHEVSLMPVPKGGGARSDVPILRKRFNLDSNLAAQPERQPVTAVAPYEPNDEDLLPERDGVFQLVYDEARPGSQLRRDAVGRVASQITTTVLRDGRLVFKVFLGPEFDDVREVAVFQPDGSVHVQLRIADYSRKYRGLAIVYTPKAPGPQTLQVRAVHNGSVGIYSEPVVMTTFNPPATE